MPAANPGRHDRPLPAVANLPKRWGAMLSLDDPRWARLDHAYGRAADIPALLRALAASPEPAADLDDDPWFTLWSSLCHQEDVYTASYAAAPHLVEIALQASGPIDFSFFLLPAAIEVSRMEGRGPAVPADLDEAYRIARTRLMDSVARHRHEDWDEATLLSALAAQAAAKGNWDVARMLLTVDSEMIARINAREPFEGEP